MKQVCFDVIEGRRTDTSQYEKGDDIFYRCLKCGGMVPSTSPRDCSCPCNGITIDLSPMALGIRDHDRVQVLRLPKGEEPRPVWKHDDLVTRRRLGLPPG